MFQGLSLGLNREIFSKSEKSKTKGQKMKNFFLTLIFIQGIAMTQENSPTQTPYGFEHIKESGGIQEYKMTNNELTILLKEDHSAPVATFMVTYNVGSRNEAIGYTGSTHLLEHLMIKGSRKFNTDKGNYVIQLLQSLGS